jgi:hypothetical protein
MKHPAQRLLGGHVFGTLTKEEQRELHRAVLDDQEVFDALMDDEPLREALADPSVRRELLRVLERPTLRDRLREWLHQPATLGHLSVATSVMFVAFIGWQLVAPQPIKGVLAGGTAPASQGTPPADLRIALFTLPLRTAIPASIQGESPAFRLTVAAAARALVVEKKPNGRVEQLFPAPGGGSVVGPSEDIAVTASREPGLHRLRVLVCPQDVEPLSLDPRSLSALQTRLTVIERTYEVRAGAQAR